MNTSSDELDTSTDPENRKELRASKMFGMVQYSI